MKQRNVVSKSVIRIPTSLCKDDFLFPCAQSFISPLPLPIIHNMQNAGTQRGPIVLFILMDEDEDEGEARMPEQAMGPRFLMRTVQVAEQTIQN